MSSPARPITLRPAPRRDPPFDDELAARHLHLVGPYDRPLPFPVEEPRPLTVPPAGSSGMPDPATWGRILLTALLESLAGRRPFRQLAGYLSPAVHNGLLATAPDQVVRQRAWARGAVVRTVHASSPAAGVAEIAAVIQTGPRARAIAARLEARDGRWRCVRLQIG